MFRIEYITFLVADFNTTYHTILGHLALTKFMAIPHYTYLVLKMPLPVPTPTPTALRLQNREYLPRRSH